MGSYSFIIHPFWRVCWHIRLQGLWKWCFVRASIGRPHQLPTLTHLVNLMSSIKYTIDQWTSPNHFSNSPGSILYEPRQLGHLYEQRTLRHAQCQEFSRSLISSTSRNSPPIIFLFFSPFHVFAIPSVSWHILCERFAEAMNTSFAGPDLQIPQLRPKLHCHFIPHAIIHRGRRRDRNLKINKPEHVVFVQFDTICSTTIEPIRTSTIYLSSWTPRTSLWWPLSLRIERIAFLTSKRISILNRSWSPSRFQQLRQL